MFLERVKGRLICFFFFLCPLNPHHSTQTTDSSLHRQGADLYPMTCKKCDSLSARWLSYPYMLIALSKSFILVKGPESVRPPPSPGMWAPWLGGRPSLCVYCSKVSFCIMFSRLDEFLCCRWVGWASFHCFQCSGRADDLGKVSGLVSIPAARVRLSFCFWQVDPPLWPRGPFVWVFGIVDTLSINPASLENFYWLVH